MKNGRRFLTFWLVLISQAGAQISGEAVGNVTSTSFAVCWEVDEATLPDVQVFSDAAGTTEITSLLKIERQSLIAAPRSLDGGTAASRAKNRSVQAAMTARNAYLVKISGAVPDQNYWVKAVVRDGGGTILHSGNLLSVTTADRAEFIKESRQLLVDFSAAAAGDFTGVIIRLGNATSPYPLFSVVGDGGSEQQAYFDLTHFLDAAGETQLVLASGSTLDLTFDLLGGSLGGSFTSDEVAFDGSFISARASTVGFLPDATVILTAIPERPTALVGHPINVDLSARDGGGQPLVEFNRSLILTSPALVGSPLASEVLENGIRSDQPVIFTTLGNQIVTVTDPMSGSETTFSANVVDYNYDNFRLHYYGDLTSPVGESSENSDGDEFNNLEEFAFGLDPTLNEGKVQYALGTNSLLKRGGPDVVLRVDSNGVDLRVTFLRLKNHVAMGIKYTPELSPDLGSWFGVSTTPVVIAEEGDVELVSVPFPYFTPEPRKARFFRLGVSIP